MNQSLADYVREQARRTLLAYEAQPNLVSEHVGIEDEVLSGGYGHRQIFELVQNAADAIQEGGGAGMVQILLTDQALYCANEGAPIDTAGVDAILNSHMSRKKGTQIGQFGIGFKSSLAISSCPEFHSHAGSFAFDHAWSADRIREVVTEAPRTPVLRLARPIEQETAVRDRDLSALLSWATTVIKLPRNVPRTAWLSEDLEEFPREFVLFSPHVQTLIIDDRVTGHRRTITALRRGDAIRVVEGHEAADWRVFAADVALSTLDDEAKDDADRKTRERQSIPLLWAVPTDRKRTRGRFWAFFPTETETTLSGILNAPWKTNADRQNLLDGPFNKAMIARAAKLVASSIPNLFDATDAGAVMDILPARAADATSGSAAALVTLLDGALENVRFIPDEHGTLQLPTNIVLRPDVLLSNEALIKTSAAAPDGKCWSHSTVERRERRAKAERLGAKKAELRDWLESVALPASPETSLRAISAIELLREEVTPATMQSIREARVVLTQAGLLVAATQPGLHLPSGQDEETDDDRVHSDLSENPSARATLLAMKVVTVSAEATINRLFASKQVDWARVWKELRRLSTHSARLLLLKCCPRPSVRVQTLDGHFSPMGMVFLPGSIVPASGERDVAFCVDARFHAEDMSLLQDLGISDAPIEKRPIHESKWFAHYRSEAIERYFGLIKPGSSRPRESSLDFEQKALLAPLDPMLGLSPPGRMALTHALLVHLPGESKWTFGHSSQSGYPRMPCDPPIRWIVRHNGMLSTSLGGRNVNEAVGPDLQEWEHALPVAALEGEQARLLGLPSSLHELNQDQWAAALDRMKFASDELMSRFYTAAAEHISTPSLIWARRAGEKVLAQPSTVFLARDDATARAHSAAGNASLLIVESANREYLIAQWGMQAPAGTVRFVAAADSSPVVDAFPGLRRYLPESTWQVLLQPCERLWLEVAGDGITVEDLTFARLDDRICHQLTIEIQALLAQIGAECGASLTASEIEDVINYALREEHRRLVQSVKSAATIPEKLVSLLGHATLLNGIPENIKTSIFRLGETPTSIKVAESALAIFGVDVLKHYAGDLAGRGVEPPSVWSGSARAQEFVDELGFPVTYAGFRRDRYDPTWDVSGPVALKPLHAFQTAISERILDLLRSEKPRRGLLSLPTGSGKTRVVVQAIVEAIGERSITGTLIWIAQSEELCEQAVQSWAEVWRALGSRERLRISRLWGQTNNRIVAATAPHVVVTTYQTLAARISRPDFDWLRQASCVIIDEAHGSIAPSYTAILDALGITVRGTERPLLGITATPFRSAADPDETKWLVNRYGAHRFDHGVIPGEEPYTTLQDMGVLARVDQETLEGQVLTLSETELADLKRFNRLPGSAETRLGENAERNHDLVESIASKPADWPILLFAASVDHAHLMAALLSLRGISAKAISGETGAGTRRHYIDEFRRGRIRVLVNYSVLSTGFDAPALRALYIARPVYSPVLYQQMIGRGLRGPLNGGKERCLVVNVRDNIAQFGGQLAFHHFEHLWRVQ